MAATGSAQYVALAGLVALLAALYLIVARLVHLGFLADFLSRTVLVGFLTGVGIQVAAGQVAGMLGVPGRRHRRHAAQAVGDAPADRRDERRTLARVDRRAGRDPGHQDVEKASRAR